MLTSFGVEARGTRLFVRVTHTERGCHLNLSPGDCGTTLDIEGEIGLEAARRLIGELVVGINRAEAAQAAGVAADD